MAERRGPVPITIARYGPTGGERWRIHASERKLMTTVHRDAQRGERLIVFTKGAPNVLLARCTRELVGDGVRPLTPERRAEILRTNEALAGEALRTLGVAARFLTPEALDRDGASGPGPDVEEDLGFAGLSGRARGHRSRG